MKYNIKDIKKNIHEIYPELSVLYKGINTTEIRVELENIIRHVIWFYSKDNLEHNEYPKFEERFNVSLSINNIRKNLAENKEFEKIENEIAFRYLMLQGDTLYEVWVSSKKRLSIICKQLRIEEEDIKWAEQKSSTDVIEKVLDLSQKVEDIEKRLFGDFEKIKSFALYKEITTNAEFYVQ